MYFPVTPDIMVCMRIRGFSLIELLVVIAILAFLINLGLGVGRRVRELARSAQCMSRQRQLYTALMTYESDFQSLPPAFTIIKLSEVRDEDVVGYRMLDLPMYQWWFKLICQRTEDYWCQKDLECPSTSFKDNYYVGLSNVLCGNFGINRSLLGFPSVRETPGYEAFSPRSKSLARLRQPGKTLLLCDSGYTLVSWQHATIDPFDFSGLTAQVDKNREKRSYIPGFSANALRSDIMSVMQDDAVKGRHPNQSVNVTFSDGHLDHIAADDLMVTGDPNHYTNQTPLWVP